MTQIVTWISDKRRPKISERNVQLMRRMAEYETAHDRERLFALYTDDVVFRDVALDVLATGKAEVR